MAWSSASLSANELAWAALDKPFLSNNALYDSTHVVRWVNSAAGVIADADESDATKPASRLYDAKPGFTSSLDSATTSFTITMNLSANPITFDWFGIINHNLDTLACTAFTLQIADNAAFTTRLEPVSTTNLSTTLSADTRFADLSLTHTTGSLRYSAVPYARITALHSSGKPFIGQLVLGRRRQQQYLPDMPWDPTLEETEANDYTSKGGVIHRVSRARGQREIAGATFHHDTADVQADALAWWDDIEGGEQPFFFVDEPATTPMGFYMKHMQPPRLVYPYTTAGSRALTLNAIEQGPTFLSQE